MINALRIWWGSLAKGPKVSLMLLAAALLAALMFKFGETIGAALAKTL